MKWIVTGGAGFIGSCFVRLALENGWAEEVWVADALTYAGNLKNLDPVRDHAGYRFCKIDIREAAAVEEEFPADASAVFHFAAESHVDRSIESASVFIETNVLGTQVLLDWAVRKRLPRFVQVSTDEVYGSLELGSDERFTEDSPLKPTSPYAASKTAADHLVMAANKTHGLDTITTRCSNNYGPYQFPEKFIPLFVTNALDGASLPLYGDGLNVRDWIHVEDHARGVYAAWQHGEPGAVYNLGGECERSNKEIAKAIVNTVGVDESTIQFVADRKAHDRRYAIDPSRAREELRFEPGPPIEARLAEVIEWYRSNRQWWDEIKQGSYRDYYARMYGAERSKRGEQRV